MKSAVAFIVLAIAIFATNALHLSDRKLIRVIREVSSRQPKASEAVILKFDRSNDVNEYGYAVETSDGTKREERGGLLPSQQEPGKDALQVGGSYSYLGPDGVTYSVNYYADETGFHAYGAHLPQPT